MKLEELLKSRTTGFIPLIADSKREHYLSVDLSSQNEQLSLDILQDASSHTAWLTKRLRENGRRIAYGGYLEQRKLYDRSDYFQAERPEEKRNIHLGMDLWCPAGTAVLSPLEGIIHSFQDNTHYGDYGPTLILQHKFKGYTFHTLYGHLSKASIANKKKGDQVRSGKVIARLGSPKVNGDYAPHLHVQIIKDMQGKEGDYPGVSSLKDLDFYKENCPDPNILLKIS